MEKLWNCAVIGTSTVGHTHVKVLSTLPNAKLAAVCDLYPDKARAALERHGITGVPIYKDQAEMHARHKLDCVNIATPSGVHMQSALIAFEHKVNVIVEKPMEIQIERIDAMIASAAANGVRLAYISQNRWQEANRALKEAVGEGRFGTIAYAACFTPWYRPDAYYAAGGWRGTWAVDGGGAIMNQSIHSIDLLQWIAGPVERVSAYAGSRIHPRIEVEDTLSASVKFKSGAFGTIMGTTAMFPGTPARIEIGGENGTAVSEAGLKVYKFRDERLADAELVDRVNANAASLTRGAGAAADIGLDLHTRNIASILASWEQGKEAETSGAEGRKSVSIINALYESARKGGAPVDVK
ncbi:MAG TPA: Gfo/Idh/MocA family oxidoreductase [Tepidisphaeraceae bacterium]|jgi:predicted dehydrogenase|nr:Gfo/Idh/MocA family oxidoreductase [Tepidisphaeraceae bacterium]